MAQPSLSTPRLRLRPWTAEDLDAFHRIWGDPQVIWWQKIHTLEVSRAQLDTALRQAIDGRGWWAAETRDAGEIVGNVLLRTPSYDPQATEIGWHFVHTHWGQGLATEAAGALVRYGFETLGLTRVEAIIVPTNVASIRVAEKLGMHREDEMEHAGLLHTRFVLTTLRTDDSTQE